MVLNENLKYALAGVLLLQSLQIAHSAENKKSPTPVRPSSPESSNISTREVENQPHLFLMEVGLTSWNERLTYAKGDGSSFQLSSQNIGMALSVSKEWRASHSTQGWKSEIAFANNQTSNSPNEPNKTTSTGNSYLNRGALITLLNSGPYYYFSEPKAGIMAGLRIPLYFRYANWASASPGVDNISPLKRLGASMYLDFRLERDDWFISNSIGLFEFFHSFAWSLNVGRSF